MKSPTRKQLDDLWTRHNAQWRDTAQIASQWQEAGDTDPRLLQHDIQGGWWQTIADCGLTLLVTREYEHLVMAMCVTDNGPQVSYMRLPHPSGLAIDRERGMIHIASTRNPNQVFDLMPARSVLPRLDVKVDPPADQPLVPVGSRFYPGCLYLHDLAVVGGKLFGSAVGHNAIVQLGDDAGFRHAWWPRCIDSDSGPLFGQNHIQLNSIAATRELGDSFFTASTDRPSARRPGFKNFPVDGRGVLFSGKTREAYVRGLTRPHSARLYRGRVALENSGYGELGLASASGYEPVRRLPGWTRGLCFHKDVAFVGTSRVIPRFRQYAPGLDVDASQCGVHAVDMTTGRMLGSLIWPYGNQVFAVDWVSIKLTRGLPFRVAAKPSADRERALFYAFATRRTREVNQ